MALYTDDELAVITRLQKKGKLTAEAVIREAKTPGSPLARHFSLNWTAKAHQKLLLIEARDFIASVEVYLINAHGEEVRVRKFASLPSDRTQAGGGYRAIETIVSNPDLTAELRADMIGELKRIAQRFSYPFPGECSSIIALTERLEAPPVKTATRERRRTTSKRKKAKAA